MKQGILIAVLLVAAAAVWAGSTGLLSGGSEDEGVTGVPARRGSLRINVIERGNLAAANSVKLKSEVEGTTTILFLIDEGTAVEPGDLLCELDTADLVERRVQQEISVQNAEASYVKAKQNHEIQQSQNETAIARAKREWDFAKLDLDKYIEGDLPQQRRRKEEEITLAKEELARATQDLEWSERLAEQGFLESTQLDTDRLKRTRAEIQLAQAKRGLELLDKYEAPRTLLEHQADVVEKERESARAKLQADARLVDYAADMRTSKARLDLQVEKLAKLDTQISKARIVAPIAGMVVYAREQSRWSNEPIQEGAPIRERQEIITIPSADGMMVEASLHESVLQRVVEGMPCLVSVDAAADRTFRGLVKYKAVLPDQNSWWANPDLRVYRTEIELLEVDERMRPGMSCSVEILVDELDDVVYVPQQTIFLDEGHPICFVSIGGTVEKRRVDVGQSNERWVEIVAGLAADEIVLMSQPPGQTLAPAPAGFGAPAEETPEGRSERPVRDRSGTEARADLGSAGTRTGGAGRPRANGKLGGAGKPGAVQKADAGGQAQGTDRSTKPAQ